MTVWDSRANNLDFMRLFFAVLVIYSHAYPLGLGSEAAEPFKRLTHGQITGGALAVDAFFIMSGFLIAASAERSPGVLAFLGKRIRRIYPAFIVSAALSALLLPLASAHFAYPSVLARTGNFLLQTMRLTEFSYVSAFRNNPYPGVINGSIWSIPYEFWCYIGIAILLATGLLHRRSVTLPLLLASWVISLLSQLLHWNFGGKFLGQLLGSPQFWARLLPLYLAGVVFYQWRQRIPLRASFAVVAAVGLALACWFSAGWTFTFPFAGTYLLFWFAFTPTVKLHHFGRFGDFSYGTYLYAFPLEQLIVQAFGHPVQPGLLFLCATPAALLAAVCSWYGVERRFLQPSRKKETALHALEKEVSAASVKAKS